MKKSFIFLAMVLALVFSGLLFSCDDPDIDQAAKKVDKAFKIVDSVASDPAVIDLIKPDKMEKLVKAKDVYLDAKTAFQLATEDVYKFAAVQGMATAAIDLVAGLDLIPQLKPYEKQIASARVILRAVIAAYAPG